MSSAKSAANLRQRPSRVPVAVPRVEEKFAAPAEPAVVESPAVQQPPAQVPAPVQTQAQGQAQVQAQTVTPATTAEAPAKKSKLRKKKATPAAEEGVAGAAPVAGAEEVVVAAEGGAAPPAKKSGGDKQLKPPAAFEQGLNLSVSKIRSIGFDGTINQLSHPLIKEIKKNKVLVLPPEDASEEVKAEWVKTYSFDVSNLSEDTLTALRGLHAQNEVLLEAKYAKKKLTEIRKQSDETKKQVSEFIKAHKGVSIEKEAYVAAFGSEFWKDFTPSKSFDELLVGDDLEVYKSLIVLASSGKIKFNSSLKVDITAFVEFLIRDFVSVYIKSTLNNSQKKMLFVHKIPQLATIGAEGGNRWFNLFLQMPVFKESMGIFDEFIQAAVEDRKSKNPAALDECITDWQVTGTSDQVFQELKRYMEEALGGQHKDLLTGVSDISKELRYELAETRDPLEFKNNATYANLNMNKAFKFVTSAVGYDLIVMICHLLSCLARNRKIKTINHDMFEEMVRVLAISYSVHPSDYQAAIEFVNERKVLHKQLGDLRKEENKQKKLAAAAAALLEQPGEQVGAVQGGAPEPVQPVQVQAQPVQAPAQAIHTPTPVSVAAA